MEKTPFYQTSNELEFHFSNIEQLKCFLLLVMEHLIFAIKQTNIEPNRAFTRFPKLLIELTRTSIFRTSNKLEHVYLLAIKLKHPIFGFERSNIELFSPLIVNSSSDHFQLSNVIFTVFL